MKAKILKHPVTILLAVAAGVVIGLYNAPLSRLTGIADFARFISIPGQIYLFYLQMTVIPIIITAIASSLGKLMRDKQSRRFIKRIVVIFLCGIVVTALAGMAVGIFGRPGADLDENTRSMLTKLISSSDTESGGALELSLSGAVETAAEPKSGLANFFTSMVPSNIFFALSSGSTMAIVFFSIVFGIAIGFLKDESAVLLVNLLTAIFEAFQKLVSSSLYLLPFGLICLMAGQIAQVGVQVFMSMSKFIILYCIGTGILFVVFTILIWIRSGIKNPFKVLSILFEPIMLAFATRNSMATLPSAISCLDKKMNFDSTSVNLTLPLGMTLGRFGNIFYFGVAVFFVVQIYGMNLTAMNYMVIFLGVILAGTATAGASGIVTLSVISIALGPLSLPAEAVLVIFMAIDPIIDPFRTLLLVYGNITATCLIAKRHDGTSVNTLTVVIRRARERRPVLYHDESGKLQGLEIELLEEIARRVSKELVILEGPMYNTADADLLAGYIVPSDSAPQGFFFSNSYATVNESTGKKQLCFILPKESHQSAQINGIINELRNEQFIHHARKQESTI
ncbi:cation:dicarboxylase symporter family transporter [Treponema sp. OttesenSCG-928-L16]|nr:cation:dicarboxylase symporter family transporter [Treponema sp. OttesenSCG-928-L16]